MKRFFLYLIIISLLVLPVSSCKKSARDIYVEAVEEWIGKEILFPDSMMTVTGEMIAPPTADFTIVSYYDSIGCTGCRMKLPFWNEFIKTVDSIRDGRTVTVLMIAASDKRDDLKHLVKFNHFPGDALEGSVKIKCATYCKNRSGYVCTVSASVYGYQLNCHGMVPWWQQ